MLLATTIACALAKNDPAKVSKSFAQALNSLIARPSGRMSNSEIRANLKSVVNISKGLKNGRNWKNRNLAHR